MCSDWVPPSTPASASIAVRTMLFSGCWAVSDTPAVCVWKRIRHDRGSVAPKRSRSSRAQMRRAARYFAISSKKSTWALKKKLSRGREVVDAQAALDRLLDVGQAVLDREGELLSGRRSGLADVIARHADRMPARHLRRAPLDHVPAQAHRRIDREAPLLLGDVLLEDVGLDRPAQALGRDAARLGGGDVEGEHHRSGRVDRHRDGDLVEVDAAEQRRHVVDGVDRDSLAADLAQRQDGGRSRGP